MNDIQAKNRILSIYREGRDAYEKVKTDEYKQLYYAILKHIKTAKNELKVAIDEFMWYGVYTFDRFVGFRPEFVNMERYDMFCRFLSTLQEMEGSFYGRTYFFHLERILWDIFYECSLLPYDEKMESFLYECEEKIKKIPLPKAEERIENNLKEKKAEIGAIINCVRNGQIKTKIHTTLPYKLTDTDAKVILKVDGISVETSLKNHSQGSTIPGTSISEGATMNTSNPSRWTTTTCELDIVADCLIDGLELKPSITLQEKENGRCWIASYDFTYKVVSALWMHLQQQDKNSAGWPPLPTDIHYIDFRIVIGDKEYEYECRSNPALVYHVTSLKKEPQNYEFIDEFPNWSVYAFQFAKVYAKSGQLKEAIFWLNVSSEALVEEFVQTTANTKELMAKIEGEEHKFDSAEEILAEQFPEMAGKVKWPNTVIHTSIFTKLKRALKLSRISTIQKEVLKKYSQVNAKRNTLFHGGNVEISTADVKKAFAAYDWLKEKLSV